jgi:hypothetical protein
MQQGGGAVDPLEYSPSGGIAMNAAELKQQIEKGEYQVDPVAVADAMLRRLREREEQREQGFAQNECSYPDSSPSASVNTTPGGPSTTKPTHVRSVPRLRGPRAISSIAAVRAGTQAHSS